MTTPSTKGPALILAGLMGLAFLGFEARTAEAKIQSCTKVYRTFYLKGPKHKAIATTGARRLSAPGTSCGFATGYRTKKQAIAAALRQCRATDRRFRDPGKCRIIEVK